VEIVGSHDLGVGITLGAHQVWMKTSIKSIESFITIFIFLYLGNSIVGVMVRVLASSAVDHGFESRLGQTKDNKIGIYCFSAKQAALRRKSKDWLAWNQNNVSEWGDMSICRLLFQ
jgi:hypothetical protein